MPMAIDIVGVSDRYNLGRSAGNEKQKCTTKWTCELAAPAHRQCPPHACMHPSDVINVCAKPLVLDGAARGGRPFVYLLPLPMHVVFRCVRTVLGGQLFLGQSQHGRLEVDGLRTAFNIEGVYGYRVDVARMQAAYGKAGYR